MAVKTMTVGDFRIRIVDQLKSTSDDCEIYFGMGDLTLRRLHASMEGRDGRPRLFQIQFNEEYETSQDDT